MVDDAVTTRVAALNSSNICCWVTLRELINLLLARVKRCVRSLYVFSGRCLRPLARVRMEYLIDILWSVRALPIRWVLPRVFWLELDWWLVSPWIGHSLVSSTSWRVFRGLLSFGVTLVLSTL